MKLSLAEAGQVSDGVAELIAGDLVSRKFRVPGQVISALTCDYAPDDLRRSGYAR